MRVSPRTLGQPLRATVFPEAAGPSNRHRACALRNLINLADVVGGWLYQIAATPPAAVVLRYAQNFGNAMLVRIAFGQKLASA